MSGRGQTTLDFLIGTATFLIAIGLIIAFVPGIIDPFTVGTEGHSVLADRAVATLTESELTAPDDPYILEKATTDAFFSDGESAAKDRLGLPDSVGLNVTLVNETSQLESVGPPPSNSQGVTSAWRVVSYDGEPAEITVRVWRT